MHKKDKTQQKLANLYKKHAPMQQSPLYISGCTQIVFGEGDPNADIIFIGEAPGRDEDEQGRPFVGRSGKLLNRALELIGINREDVYITNIVKCRPPDNRTPTPEELKTGKTAVLEDQIRIINPKVICTLGSAALRGLLEHDYRITKIRGTELSYNGIPVIPTYHPAYILRNRSVAQTFVQDIENVVQIGISGNG